MPKPLRFLLRKPGRFTDRLLRIAGILIEESARNGEQVRILEAGGDIQQRELATLSEMVGKLSAELDATKGKCNELEQGNRDLARTIEQLGLRADELELEATRIRAQGEQLVQLAERTRDSEFRPAAEQLAHMQERTTELEQRTARLDTVQTEFSKKLSTLEVRARSLHPRVFFVHVPKTAGTSVRLFLEQIFQTGEFLTDGELQRIRLEMDPARPELCELLRSRLVVQSHSFSLNEALAADPTAILLTFWREPVRQMMSLFDYYRSFNAEYTASLPEEARTVVLLAKTDDFFRFMREGKGLQNQQCRAFDPAYGSCTKADLSRSIEECEVFLKRFHCLGITEHYQRSLKLLTCLLRVPWNEKFEMEVNVTAKNAEAFPKHFQRVERTVITEAHRAVMEEMSPLDCAMYPRAIQLFEEQCARWSV